MRVTKQTQEVCREQKVQEKKTPLNEQEHEQEQQLPRNETKKKLRYKQKVNAK